MFIFTPQFFFLQLGTFTINIPRLLKKKRATTCLQCALPATKKNCRSAYLNETHADGAHLGELIDGLKAVVHGLRQQLGKLLVVENLQAAAAGNLAHGRGMEAVVVVTVTALDEDTTVTQTLCVHLPANIVQMDT